MRVLHRLLPLLVVASAAGCLSPHQFTWSNSDSDASATDADSRGADSGTDIGATEVPGSDLVLADADARFPADAEHEAKDASPEIADASTDPGDAPSDAKDAAADAPKELPDLPDLLDLTADPTDAADATDAADLTDVAAPPDVLPDGGDVLPETVDLAGQDACIADCTGKECGDDGCGGTCGSCEAVAGCIEGSCQKLPALVWAKCFGPEGKVELGDMSVDPSGNVHLVGYFETESLDFGNGPLLSHGSDDLFVAKLDTVGGLVWASSFGGTSFDVGQAVTVDDAGNVIVAGYFNSVDLDTGTGPLTNKGGGGDVFVFRIAPSGGLLWSKPFGSGTQDVVAGVATGEGGTIFLVGSFGVFGGPPPLDFGGGPLAQKGERDTFVVALTAQGQHAWSKSFGGNQDDPPYRVVMSGGALFLSGTSYSDSVDFGGGPIPSASGEIFLAKLSEAGEHIWSHRYGGNGGGADPFALAVDTWGRASMAGRFHSGPLELGQSVWTPSDNDVFLMAVDGSGEPRWSEAFGTTSNDGCFGLAGDGAGNLVLTGFTFSPSGEIDLGGGIVKGQSFAAAYADGGAHLWSKGFGGSHGKRVGLDGVGNVYVATDGGTNNFGGFLKPGFQQGQVCLAKFAQYPVPCVPSCAGKQCGPDACGGNCGNCVQNEACSPSGQCEAGK